MHFYCQDDPRIAFSVFLGVAVSLIAVGCGPKQIPVLDGDSAAVIALKNAGADVGRLPSVGKIKTDTGEMDYSGLPLRVDLSAISLTPEIIGHLNEVENVQELTFGDSGLNDELMQQLTNFKSLSILNLAGSDITDESLRHLAENTKRVYTMNLSDTQVTGAGLASLPVVGVLSLENLDIGDDDLSNLKHLNALTFLTLSGTRVTPGGVSSLKKKRPGLMVMGIPQN